MHLRTHGIILSSLACLVALNAAAATSSNPSNHPGSGAPVSRESVAVQLKNLVSEAVGKLGPLEPWQKKVVEEEVLPQYQRFFRDYRQTGTRVSGEVDQEILHNYLRFYGPKVLKFQNKNVLILLRSDSGCAKCGPTEVALKELVKNRLERRGLVPTWISVEDAGVTGLKGQALDDRIASLSRTKGLAGALVLDWGLQPPDDEDSAHADEKVYFVHAFVSFRGFGKQVGNLEILENDSFETASARLLVDAFTAFGAKVGQETPAMQLANRKEVLVQVSGFNDFQHYQKVKDLLGTYLKNVSSITERQISKGMVILAVQSDQSREEIQKQLVQAAQDPAVGSSVKMGVASE